MPNNKDDTETKWPSILNTKTFIFFTKHPTQILPKFWNWDGIKKVSKSQGKPIKYQNHKQLVLKHPQNYTFKAILIFPNQHVFSGEIYTMFGNRCDPIVRLANQLSAAVTRATTSTVLYKAFRHIPHFSKPLNSLSSFIRFEKKPQC